MVNYQRGTMRENAMAPAEIIETKGPVIRRFVLSIIFVLLTFSATASGPQQDAGSIRGTVVDENNVAVAGALGTLGKGTTGPSILLFDWASGKVTHTIKLGAPLEGYVYDLAWHPDGYLIEQPPSLVDPVETAPVPASEGKPEQNAKEPSDKSGFACDDPAAQ